MGYSLPVTTDNLVQNSPCALLAYIFDGPSAAAFLIASTLLTLATLFQCAIFQEPRYQDYFIPMTTAAAI